MFTQVLLRLPGLAVSRSQAFRDIKAWETAKEKFPVALLDAFLSGGYALSVRPTVEEPLGRYTKPCKQVLAKLKSEQPNEKQCATVLDEATAIIKAKAKKNRAAETPLTADEKHDRLLKDFHNLAVSYFEDLAKAVLPGESYSARDVRDDLEAFLCHFLTAAGLDVLEFEPRSLPEGYKSLSLPGSVPDSSDTATRQAALAATAA
jgi:hypothetical protein